MDKLLECLELKYIQRDNGYKILDFSCVNSFSQHVVGLLSCNDFKNDSSKKLEIKVDQIAKRIEYFRRIIDVRVVNELKTMKDKYTGVIERYDVLDGNKKSKPKRFSNNDNFSNSFFEGYLLLAYTLINVACVKYNELLEDIENIQEQYRDQKVKGKGSVDLKIDKKILEWQNSYLYPIKNTLQKYAFGLQSPKTYADHNILQSNLDLVNLLLEDIDKAEQSEDGQVKINTDGDTASFVENQLRTYFETKSCAKLDHAKRLNKRLTNTQPVLNKTRGKSRQRVNKEESKKPKVVSSKQLRKLNQKRPKSVKNRNGRR